MALGRVASVASAFPRHYYPQEILLAALRVYWEKRYFNVERIEQLHRNVLVGGRYLALPLESYGNLETFGQANDAFLEVALELGETATRRALERAGCEPREVGAFLSTTVTGIATPSLEARLMNRIEFAPSLKRLPLFGLGCLAGAAGLARAADYVRAYPRERAALLSVELCSLTLQREDVSIPNLIATGLFGDGAACAVVTGMEVPGRGPKIVATESVFYPNSERIMGWDVSERGFQVVLSAEVPEVVRRYLRADVDRFLRVHGFTRADIGVWLAHPGGPKVLEAMEEALELPRQAFERSWRTLQEAGNLSSTSVLLVLEEVLAEPPAPGTLGLLLALGPGFASEFVLLEWS